MFRPALVVVYAVIATLAPARMALAQESWVGKDIMPKKPGIKLSDLEKGGKLVGVVELKLTMYTVLGDKDGRLKVRQNAAEGWFDKEDAVLLENALSYFTQRIKADPKDDYALGFAAWFGVKKAWTILPSRTCQKLSA